MGYLGGMEAGIFTEAGTLFRIASRMTSVDSVCRTTYSIAAMTMGIGWNVTALTRTAAGGASWAILLQILLHLYRVVCVMVRYEAKPPYSFSWYPKRSFS